MLAEVTGPVTLPENGLSPSARTEINDFLEREARRYGLRINTPVRINVMPLSANLPPPVPRTNNPLVVAWWSLKMRYWAWRQMRGVPGLEPDIQVFVQYREASSQPLLDRSVGMQKGRYALVQAYADEASTARNNFVIAHELLHVLGATDKYDPLTGQALKPEGLAEPDRQPLFPQQHAEVMAGVVALTPSRGRMPTSLNECVIGAETAQEIGW